MNLDTFRNKKVGIVWITTQNFCYLLTGFFLFVYAKSILPFLLGIFVLIDSIANLIVNWEKYKNE